MLMEQSETDDLEMALALAKHGAIASENDQDRNDALY